MPSSHLIRKDDDMITNLTEILKRLKGLDSREVDLILFDCQIEWPCRQCRDKWNYCSCSKPNEYTEILQIIGER
jgi:hypothetical protein